MSSYDDRLFSDADRYLSGDRYCLAEDTGESVYKEPFELLCEICHEATGDADSYGFVEVDNKISFVHKECLIATMDNPLEKWHE